MAGFVPETPEQYEASLTKAHSVAQVAVNLDEANAELDRDVARILRGGGAAPAAGGGTDFGGKGSRQQATELHDKRADEVLALAGNPELLADRVAKNLGNFGNVAPGMAVAMSATASRAAAYLAQVAQAPPQRGPLAPKWVPSEAERAKFAQIGRAHV